jgi:hypothetical protein
VLSYAGSVKVADRTRTTLAALAALALVASGLLAGWHRASVMHATCAEHGDEVHVEKVAGAERPDEDGASRLVSTSWQEAEGDHHCQLSATSRESVGADADPCVVTADPPVDHAPLAGVVADAAGAPLLRLAPKTSPPRV